MLRADGAPSLPTNVAHIAKTATMSTIQTKLPRIQRCSGIHDSPARDRGGQRFAAMPRGAEYITGQLDLTLSHRLSDRGSRHTANCGISPHSQGRNQSRI